MQRRLVWGVLGLFIAAGVAIFAVWRMTAPPGEAGSAPADLLSAPQDVRLELSVDIPKGSEPENPAHQVIDATGVMDLAASTGELIYDFNELSNAAGFLGHFDTMEVRFGDGAIYFDVFSDGPPWVRVGPSDIGTGEVARLRDILLTNPLTLTSFLEVEATEEEGAGGDTTRAIGPDELAAAGDPHAAAVGATPSDWGVDMIEVVLSQGEAGLERMVVAFAYRPGGIGGTIEVQATYELERAEAPPDVELPGEDETRQYSDIFGAA